MKLSGTIDLGMVIATYGALLSSFLVFKSWLNSKPRVSVVIKAMLIPNKNSQMDEHLSIEISNHGSITVHLSGWSFLLPDKRQIIFPRTGVQKKTIPCDLLPGKSNFFAVSKKELLDSLQENGFSNKTKLRGCVRDELSREFKSKEYSFV